MPNNIRNLTCSGKIIGISYEDMETETISITVLLGLQHRRNMIVEF